MDWINFQLLINNVLLGLIFAAIIGETLLSEDRMYKMKIAAIWLTVVCVLIAVQWSGIHYTWQTEKVERQPNEIRLIRRGDLVSEFSTIEPGFFYFRKHVALRGHCPEYPPIAGRDIVASRYGDTWTLKAVGDDGDAVIEVHGSAERCIFNFPIDIDTNGGKIGLLVSTP